MPLTNVSLQRPDIFMRMVWHFTRPLSLCRPSGAYSVIATSSVIIFYYVAIIVSNFISPSCPGTTLSTRIFYLKACQAAVVG